MDRHTVFKCSVAILGVVLVVAGLRLRRSSQERPSPNLDAARLLSCMESGNIPCIASFESAAEKKAGWGPDQLSYVYGSIICPFWAKQRKLGLQRTQGLTEQKLAGESYVLTNGQLYNRIVSIEVVAGKPQTSISSDLLDTFTAMYASSHDGSHPATLQPRAAIEEIQNYQHDMDAHGVLGIARVDGGGKPLDSWKQVLQAARTSEAAIESGRMRVMGPNGRLLAP
jgi:hypothetical protein